MYVYVVCLVNQIESVVARPIMAFADEREAVEFAKGYDDLSDPIKVPVVRADASRGE